MMGTSLVGKWHHGYPYRGYDFAILAFYDYEEKS